MDVLLRDELASILATAPQPAPSATELAFVPIDNSPRAIQERAIIRMAQRHGWPDAIPMFLDTKGVAHLSDLTDPQLDDLAQRMEGYIDAAECGHYLPDCFPAT